jgi:hypothetical protein
MSRIILQLVNAQVRARAHRLIDEAEDGTRVEIKSARRSLDANAAMWARLAEISEQVEWYGQKLSSEDWKDVFTAALRRARVVPGLDNGTFVPLGMRTSDMTKAEMSDLLELIAAFGAERGVVFRDSVEAA